MFERIIHALGGYTAEEYEALEEDFHAVFGEMGARGETIQELQALIPKPKKMGRPRKVNTEPVKVV